MIEEKDDYAVSDSVSQNFDMLIGEKMTCLTCHQNKRLDVLKYDLFIMPLGEISSLKNNLRPIRHHKMTHLAKNCVTTNDLMGKFYEKKI